MPRPVGPRRRPGAVRLSERAGPQRLADRHVELGDVLVVDRRPDVGQVVVERGVELLRGGDDDRGPRRRSAPGTNRSDRSAGARPAAAPARPRRRRRAPPRRAAGDRGRSRRPGRARSGRPPPSERWVKVEKKRIDSISSPNSSIRPPGPRSSRRRRGCRRGPRTGRGRRPARPARSRSRRAARRRRPRSTSSPFVSAKPAGRSDASGTASARATALATTIGGSPAGGADERVEGGDPQADEVRRRRQVGLVAGAARGVVADPARREIGAELAGEVAGAAIVGGDAEDRPPRQARLGLGERGEQERPQADGGRRLEPRTGFRCGGLGGQRRDVLVCMSEL